MDADSDVQSRRMDCCLNCNDDILTRLVKKMDQLESNNATLASMNQGLLRRVDDLEERIRLTQARAEDTEMKVAVLRDSQLRNAAHRVFAITELLERILLLCLPEQLLSLQNVSNTFRAAITDLPTLRTKTFRNPKDVLDPRKPGLLRRDLQPPLQLNPFFAESWQTPIGRTYLTMSALPTSVSVTFPDRYRPRVRSEHRLPRKGSTPFREDISAIAEVCSSTVLDMMRIAQVLERCYTCGEKVWTRTGDSDSWSPKSATDQERQLLRAVQSRPSYSA